jgi:hypothetical protein
MLLGIGVGFNGSLNQFGLGFYCVRVRSRLTGGVGMKFSIYLAWFEFTCIISMGKDS